MSTTTSPLPRSFWPVHTLRTRRIVNLLLVVSALWTLGPAARAGAAELPSELTAQIDATVSKVMEDERVPGVSVAIAIDGQLVYEHGYGLADLENNVPATPQTIYRLASISKMFTATAAMQLAEQGKLDLDAPIQKYVPSFPEKEGVVTAELLLKHQSGIRHYRNDETRSAVFYSRVGDALAIFQDDRLLFKPGEKFSYTTYGYNLLGTAIENAAGQDYVSYVREHICQPAGITTMQADNPYLIIPHRAAGYRLHGRGKTAELRNDFMVDVTNKIPGGGWCATAGDLVRFALTLMDGKLVKPETLQRMWTPQMTSLGKETDCGLGCFIETVAGQRRISHSGGQPKVSTYLVFAPAEKTVVALMCNRSGADVHVLADLLMKQLAPAAAAAP